MAGELESAREQLGLSVDIFRRLDDDSELSKSLRERGFVEVFGGSLADAEWLLGEAEELSERLKDAHGHAWVRQHQAWVAFLSGDIDTAEQRLALAASGFKALGIAPEATGRTASLPTCGSSPFGSRKRRPWPSRSAARLPSSANDGARR